MCFQHSGDLTDHMAHLQSCVKYRDAQGLSSSQKGQISPPAPEKPEKKENMPKNSTFLQLCPEFSFEELLEFRFVFPLIFYKNPLSKGKS